MFAARILLVAPATFAQIPNATGTTATPRTSYSYTCRYDFPAVTDRYVSCDGSTEVLHQHFSYYTDWSNNTTFNWNYKTTTVTTTDVVSGTTSTTVYTHSPLNSPFVPTCGSCSMTAQMPTEQMLQYENSSGTVLKTVTKSSERHPSSPERRDHPK